MKVPEPRKLKSGTWFIQLRLGGESIPVTAQTKTECRHLAEKIKADHRAGKRVRSTKADLTLGDAIDQYIESKRNSLSPSTIRGYKIIRDSRFQTYMDQKIRSIKSWQSVYDSERDRLSGKTLRNSWALIKTVYKRTTGKELPEVSMLPVVKSERPYLDPDQINAFQESVKGKQCEIPALLALSSLRCSEILAMTWDKVDFVNSRILVSGAVVPNENNVYVRKQTNKTQDSRRYVPIFIPQLLLALQTAKKAGDDVVTYKTESGLLRAINAVCENAGLPQVGVHGLRHSFASLCVHLKIPEETAMSIGGWSDYVTMRKIYTHVSQRDQLEHVAALTGFYDKNAN